jgi:hypothetical protein
MRHVLSSLATAAALLFCASDARAEGPWQTTWIAVETKMVVSNYRLGIGLSLPW